MLLPVVEPLFAANQNGDVKSRIAAGENPVAVRKFLRWEIIDCVVIDLRDELPFLLTFVPAPRLKFKLFVRLEGL